jgi:hypothetical protein
MTTQALRTTPRRLLQRSLEIPLARSAKAALNEASDAVYRFILVCVGFRDDYEVRGLSVKLLTESDT